VISGIPQGSVLGLLLFVSYTKDVATAISSDSDVNMFADDNDIALYCVIRKRADYVQRRATYICRRMLIPFPLAMGKNLSVGSLHKWFWKTAISPNKASIQCSSMIY